MKQLYLNFTFQYVDIRRKYTRAGDAQQMACMLEKVPLDWDSDRLYKSLMVRFPDIVAVHRTVVIPTIDNLVGCSTYITFLKWCSKKKRDMH